MSPRKTYEANLLQLVAFRSRRRGRWLAGKIVAVGGHEIGGYIIPDAASWLRFDVRPRALWTSPSRRLPCSSRPIKSPQIVDRRSGQASWLAPPAGRGGCTCMCKRPDPTAARLGPHHDVLPAALGYLPQAGYQRYRCRRHAAGRRPVSVGKMRQCTKAADSVIDIAKLSAGHDASLLHPEPGHPALQLLHLPQPRYLL